MRLTEYSRMRKPMRVGGRRGERAENGSRGTAQHNEKYAHPVTKVPERGESRGLPHQLISECAPDSNARIRGMSFSHSRGGV
jgi:hypothetical protein